MKDKQNKINGKEGNLASFYEDELEDQLNEKDE